MVVTIAAVLTGLTALAPPPPATVTVVTAARQLSAGVTIQARDLQLSDLPAQAVPQGALTELTDLVGEKAAGPVPERQVLTPSSLLRQRSSVRSLVVAPLPLADERVSGLLQAGDVVDVLAADTQTGKTRVVASAVHVLTGTITAGDTSSGSGDGGLVLVEVSAETATALAAAGAVSALSIVWH